MKKLLVCLALVLGIFGYQANVEAACDCSGGNMDPGCSYRFYPASFACSISYFENTYDVTKFSRYEHVFYNADPDSSLFLTCVFPQNFYDSTSNFIDLEQILVLGHGSGETSNPFGITYIYGNYNSLYYYIGEDTTMSNSNAQVNSLLNFTTTSSNRWYGVNIEVPRRYNAISPSIIGFRLCYND